MLTIHVLGKPELYTGNNYPIVFPTLQMELIFAYIVCAGHPVSHTEIAELFWSHLTLAGGLAKWHEILPILRNQLGTHLEVTPQQVYLNQSQRQWVDLHEMEYLLADKETAAVQKSERLQTFYRGELLAGVAVPQSSQPGKWLHQKRQSVQQRVMAAVHELTEQFLQQSDYANGLKTSRWGLTLEPTDERGHRLRMLLFWRSKQQAAALLQYKLCCTDIKAAFGREPDAETQSLYQEIVRVERSKSPPEANSPTGEWRPPPHNLPRQLNHLIGRVREVEFLWQRLRQHKSTLTILIGEGGVGKTRLAIEVATLLINQSTPPHDADGVWLVPCADLSEATTQEQFIRHIAATIGIHLEANHYSHPQLIEMISRKSMLLLLDSFEQLAGQVELLLTLLQRSSGLQILLTSRNSLNIQSGVNYYLNGLELPPLLPEQAIDLLADDEWQQLLQVASIELFNERAGKIEPNFVVSRANLSTVAKLCALVNGNPLAIEMICRLLPIYDLDSITTELARDYTILVADVQELPHRLRSMHSNIDYSWQMLPATLQKTMAQCSIFRGQFSYQAGCRITGAAQEEIVQLVNRSLLQNSEQRYLTICEMPRQFAAQKLASDPQLSALTQRSHCDFYIDLLHSWWQGRESRHIAARLLPELDNIYAAWEWAFEQQIFEKLSQTIIAFTQFHIYAGRLAELGEWIERYQQRLQTLLITQMAHGAAGNEGDSADEMQNALNYAACIIDFYRNPQQQSAHVLQALKTQTHQQGYLYLAANIEFLLGNHHRQLQHWQQARSHFELAVRYAQGQQQPYASILPLHQLATIARLQRRNRECEAHLQHASLILQRYPDVILEESQHKIYNELCHTHGLRSLEPMSISQKTGDFINQPTHL